MSNSDKSELENGVPDTLEKSLRDFPVIVCDEDGSEIEIKLEELVEIDDILRIIESHTTCVSAYAEGAVANSQASGAAIT